MMRLLNKRVTFYVYYTPCNITMYYCLQRRNELFYLMMLSTHFYLVLGEKENLLQYGLCLPISSKGSFI